MDKGSKGGGWADKLAALANKIPGYKGYAERAERREVDSIQREYLAKRLTQIKSVLQTVQEDCLAEGNLDAMEPCDRMGNKIDRLVERIRHASRGYAGFFDAVKVNEEELARIYEFDLALVVNVNSIEEGVQGLNTAIGDNFSGAVRALRSSLDELDSKLDERDRVLKGVE
ncbi:hypothetical protein IJT17_03420 [bacterium]|nr:hypothetical protein [bacterium]